MQKEIRNGNYYQFTGSSCDYEEGKIICFQSRIWVELHEGTMNIGDLKPVPLTHEILLACGFTHVQNATYLNGNQYRLQVCGHGKDGTWFDGIENRNFRAGKPLLSVNLLCRGNYVCAGVDYLHELQNLYFAVKRLELPIKSKITNLKIE